MIICVHTFLRMKLVICSLSSLYRLNFSAFKLCQMGQNPMFIFLCLAIFYPFGADKNIPTNVHNSLYMWKLFGSEICTNCVTFCQFSLWTWVKMNIWMPVLCFLICSFGPLLLILRTSLLFPGGTKDEVPSSNVSFKGIVLLYIVVCGWYRALSNVMTKHLFILSGLLSFSAGLDTVVFVLSLFFSLISQA